MSPSGGVLVADYQFQNNFTSSVSGAPAIEPTVVDQVAFVDAVELNGRRVLKFNSGHGLRLGTAGLVDTDRYSVVVGFAFDSIGGFTRVLDPKDPTGDNAWFLQDGRMGYHPFTYTPTPVISAGKFAELALVADGDLVRGYVDGIKQFDVFDPSRLASIRANGLVHFMRQANGSYAPGGRVTRIRIYNGSLNDAEVAALDSAVPRPVLIPSSLCPAPAGLITWLRGEGNAADERGLHQGTIVGTVDFPAGRVGRAFGFNGSDGSVDLGPWFDLQTFTFSLWVKEGNSQQTYADIFDNNHTDSRSLVLQYSNTGHTYVILPSSMRTKRRGSTSTACWRAPVQRPCGL